MKRIVLAGGCFWGIEAYFNKFDGILRTEVGYANGITENPTYEDVKTSGTGYAEVCYIEYDENTLSLDALLLKFWDVIDPTVVNRQGPDLGHQYRTGIFYIEDEDLDIILSSRENEQKKLDKDIVTEIEALKNYYPAEEYHQKYLEKNPAGYCHIDLSMF